MENLDPASVEAQRHVLSEIFRSVHQEPVTLGALLQAYDHTLAKHGICASDLAGIQIYRALLQWGREHGSTTIGRGRQRARAAVDSALQPLQYAPAKWEPNLQLATADAHMGLDAAVRDVSIVTGGVPPARLSSPAIGMRQPVGQGGAVTPAIGSNATPKHGDAATYESKFGPEALQSEQRGHTGPQMGLSAHSPKTLPSSSRLRSGSPTPFPAFLGTGLQDATSGVYGVGRHTELPPAPSSQNLRYGRSSSPAAPQPTPTFPDWSPLVAPAVVPKLPEPVPAAGASSSQSLSRHGSGRSSSPTPRLADLGPLVVPTSACADLDARLLGTANRTQQEAIQSGADSPRGFAPPLELRSPSINDRHASAWPGVGLGGDWQNHALRRPQPAPAQSSMSPYTLGPPSVLPAAKPTDEPSWPLPAASTFIDPGTALPPTDVVLAEADLVLSEAFAYRRILRSMMSQWRRGARQSRVTRRVVAARAAALLSYMFRFWCEASCTALRVREQALQNTAAWSRRRNALLKKQMVCMWHLLCCRRAELTKQHAAVRRLLAGFRLRQWFQVYQEATAHAVWLQRTLLIEWRAVVRQCRKIRVILADQAEERSFQKRADGFYWWQGFCRRWQAERQLMLQGASLGRRTRLSRAVLQWHGQAQQRRTRHDWLRGTLKIARNHTRRAAIHDWHGIITPQLQRKRLAVLLQGQRHKRSLKSSIARWHDRLEGYPGKSHRLLRSLANVMINRRLQIACLAWCDVVQQEKARREIAERRHRVHLLQAALRTFESHAIERRLTGTYKAWADLLWVRSLSRRGWSAWHSWLITSGRVRMMCNEVQILAAWRWLRVSAACGGPSSGVAQPFRDPHLHPGEAVSLCMHRYGETAMQCGAMQTVSAVDMFFGCAPFMVHPHRFHSWKWSLLAIFVQALLRQVLRRWFTDTRHHRIFRIRQQRTFSHAIFHSWSRLASRRKTCNKNLEQATKRLIFTRRRRLVSRWAKGSRVHAALRHGAHQFAFASRERLCRRAFLAWCHAKARQDRVFACGQAVVARYLLGLERDAFSAMLGYWQHARQAALLVRLSGLFLRKRSLRNGIDRLHAHVFRQKSLRLEARTHRQSLQRTWLHRWWCQHRWCHDLRRRDAAATSWSKSKLTSSVCSAWSSWTRVAVTQRQQISAHRRCKVLHAAVGHLRDWRRCTDRRSARRYAESTLRRDRCLRSRTRVFRWWRSSTVEALAWKLSTHLSESQLVGEIFSVWKQHTVQSRAFDVCCIGSIVLQRFRVFIAVWHHEVMLSQLVRQFFKKRAQHNLRVGLAIMREHVGHCRRMAKEKDVARARWQARLLAECHRGWVAHVRQCICWRACVEAMRDAANGRMCASCMYEWHACVERQQDLRARRAFVERKVRELRAAQTLGLMRQKFRAARGFRAATCQMTFSILSACLIDWQQVARSRSRCHRAIAKVSQVLHAQRCSNIWHHWRARFAAREQFRQHLAAFRDASISRRLQVFVTAWHTELVHARILQARLANARELAKVALLRRSLRGLALWCIHCSECDEALERVASTLRCAGLRAGISWWSSGVSFVQDLESRVVASVRLQNQQSQRLSFDSWVRVWLLLKQERSLAAMAKHFRERRLAAKLWLAWLSAVCRELALRSCAAMARERSLERSKFGAWRKWRRHVAARWLSQEQARKIEKHCRDSAVRRSLRWWHCRLERLQRLKDSVATIVQRRGLQDILQPAVVLSALLGAARSPTGLLQALANASVVQHACQAWRAFVHTRQVRSQELVQLLSEATARRNAGQCAKCFAALAALSSVLVTRRGEISAFLLRQRSIRCFRGWATLVNQLRQALVEFHQRRLQLTGVTLRTILHNWVGYHLSHRSLQLLSSELRERYWQRRTRGGLLVWLRATVVEQKAQQGMTRRRFRMLSLAVAGWRRYCCECSQVAQFLLRTARALLHPALRAWRRATLQRRGEQAVFYSMMRAWQSCVAACRARRSCTEVLRSVRATRLRQQALSHWSLRLSKMQRGPGVMRPCHVVVRRFWGRWRSRTLRAYELHQREVALCTRVKRSRACWGLSTWRGHLLQTHAALSQKFAVETWTRRSHVMRGWVRWRAKTVTKRSLASREQALATWMRIACLSCFWLAWRRWTARQIRDAALSSSWRHGTALQRRSIAVWHMAVLCVARDHLGAVREAARLAQRTLSVWRARLLESKVRRLAMVSAACRRLHRALSAWCCMRSLALAVRQRATAAHTRHEWSTRRSILYAWLELQLRNKHFRWLLAEVHVSASLRLARCILAPWRERTLKRRQAAECGFLLVASCAETMRARRFHAWKQAARVSQTGAVLHAQLAVREQARRFQAWRRATAASRVCSTLQSAKACLDREALYAAFRQLAGQHRAFQAAFSEFAEKHPSVVDRLRELLEAGREDRREALLAWHVWAKSRQHLQARQRSLCQLLGKRTRSQVLHTWSEFRVHSVLRRQHKARSSQAFKASIDRHRQMALHCWHANAADARRGRFSMKLADSMHHRWVQRTAWLQWLHLAAMGVEARSAAHQAGQAVLLILVRDLLHAWGERCRWAAAMRLATLHFTALQVRRRVLQALGAWRTIAQELIALATVHELQADDLWRNQRRALGAAVAIAWRQEVERARRAGSQARAAKVLACWKLYTQEQVLLRRYLGQCSMSNFRGDTTESASSAPGAVQPADFERLYEQMAAHRWDLTDVMSD